MNIFQKSTRAANGSSGAPLRWVHEHDLADYEVYIWDINTDKEKGPVRITFHTGNDRWPDIHIGNVENSSGAPQ